MAITITTVRRSVEGKRALVVADVAFGAGYATGGESVTPALVGLSSIETIIAENGASGQKVVYDRANNKVKLYTAGSTEQTNSSNPGITVRMRITGTP